MFMANASLVFVIHPFVKNIYFDFVCYRRGKSPRYYNQAVGPWLVYSCVTKIRETFNCGPDGPETNV